MARIPRLHPGELRSRTGAHPTAPFATPRRKGRCQPAVQRQYRLHQHDLPPTAACLSGQPRNRTPHQEPGALECHGHGGPRQPRRRENRRPHLHLRLGRNSLRSGFQTTSFAEKNHRSGGDQIYFQGHASPGIYARAFLEGRLSERHLANFRRELRPGGGLSSYPHPWLMPDFWEFPTVSMGLGPILAIYQARFNRYLEDRGLKEPSDSKVWAFLGERRDRRARNSGCDHARLARAVGQP